MTPGCTESRARGCRSEPAHCGLGSPPANDSTLPRPAQGLIGLCRRAGHARPEVGARALVRCPAALARARASLFATRSLTRAGRRQLAARGAILGPPGP